MKMFALEVIISGVIGGGIGYLTNHLAIEMLFKEVGIRCWKFGGIIQRNDKKFVDDLSNLVEKSLVTAETLKPKLSSEHFKTVLKNCVEDIIKNELPKQNGNLSFGDIADINKSIDGLIKLIDNAQPQILDGIYNAVRDNKLQTFISKEQYSYIVKANLKNIFIKKEHYEKQIQSTLASFLRDKPVNSIISDSAIMRISKNICAVIQTVDFSDFDPKINRAFDNLLKALKIEALIKSLEKDLSDMKISDFVNDPQKTSRDLIKRVLDFISSKNGKEILIGVIADFIKEARKIQLKLKDVLDPQRIGGIENFCQKKLPVIFDYTVDVIKESEREVETIINKTVDRVLGESLGGKIIKFFKDIFIGDLAKKRKLVNTIIELVKKYGDDNKEKLSKDFIALIETKTIGDIIGLIHDSGVLNESFLVDLLCKNIKAMENKDLPFIDSLLGKPVSVFLKYFELSTLIKTKLLPHVLKNIKKKYIYSDEIKHRIGDVIKKELAKIANQKVGDVLKDGKIRIPLDKKKIQDYLLKNWDEHSTLSEKTIENIFGSSVQMPKFSKPTFADIWDKHKNLQINFLYNKFQNEDTYTTVSEKVLNLLKNKLDGLLKNVVKIGDIVRSKSQLAGMDAEKINKTVKKFMREKMKPIEILGAVFGLIFGIAFSFIDFTKIFSDNLAWLKILAYSLIFAFVGVFTNWTAIKALFWPRKSLFNLDRSPFIGIFASKKRRPEFAEDMGALVNDKMLNDDTLKDFFKDNKININEKMGAVISNNDYAVIDDLLNHDTKLDLSNYIYNRVKYYIGNNYKDVSNEISKWLKNIVKKGNLRDHIPALMSIIINGLKKLNYAGILADVIENETKNKNLSVFKKLMEKYLDFQLEKFVDAMIATFADKFTWAKVKKHISGQNDKFIEYIEKNNIESIVGKTTVGDWIKKLNNEMEPILLKLIDPIINKLKTDELNPDKRLNEIFGGSLPNIFNNNIGYIVDYIKEKLCKKENDIVSYIKKEHPTKALLIGDNILRTVVHELLHEELPIYLAQKQNKIKQIVEAILCKHKLSDLGFTNKSLEIDTIKSKISDVIKSPRIQRGLTNILSNVITKLCDQPLEALLAIINIKHIDDLMRKIEPLLSKFVDLLRNNLSNEKVREIILKTVKSIVDESMERIKITDVLHHINFEKELRTFAQNITEDENIINDVTQMVEEILETVLKEPTFYDDAILKDDLEQFIKNSDNVFEKMRDTSKSAIYEILTNINRALTAETKQYICECLTDAIVNVAENNTSDMMRAIDISKVVEEAINKMDTKEIEDFFNGFAKDYFNKIIMYGGIGAFGGPLNYVVSVMLVYFAK